MYQKAVCIHTEWTTSRIYLVKEMIAKGYHDDVQLDPRPSGNKVDGNKRTYFVDDGMVCNGNMQIVCDVFSVMQRHVSPHCGLLFPLGTLM